MLTLQQPVAREWGFPSDPRPGQKVLDTRTGIVWQWFGDESGLGDLGFWGALIGLGTSIFGSLFGGGKKEKQQLEEAKRIIEQQQAENAVLQQKLEQSKGLGKKHMILIGFVLVGFFVVRK